MSQHGTSSTGVAPGQNEPLLEGSDAERAMLAVAAIRGAIRKQVNVDAAARSTAMPPTDTGYDLAFSDLGAALLLMLTEHTDTEWSAGAIAQILGRAITSLNADQSPPLGLFTGYPGIAWILAIRETLIAGRTGDFETVDAVIAALRDEQDLSIDGFDVLTGLTGVGLFALSVVWRPGAEDLLRRVINALASRALYDRAGATWVSPSRFLPEPFARRFPDGHYNLGLAHGIPGVISFLGQTYAAGFDRDLIGGLLEAAVEWLLAHRLRTREACVFPSFVFPDGVSEPSRLGWCYGDPGVSTALMVVADLVQHEGWRKAAIDAALTSLDVRPERSGVNDVGLCHGIAGVGHMYSRLYQRSGREEFAHAARRWMRRALEFESSDSVAAGFGGAPNTHTGRDQRRAFGYLYGAGGVGLVLSTAVGQATSIGWDAPLLLSPAVTSIVRPSSV